VAQLAPQALADDLPERARILELAARLDPEFVQLAYQIAVHGRKELPLAPDDQAGFVMTLLRLHAFRPVLAGAAVRSGPVFCATEERPARLTVMEPRQKSTPPASTPASSAQTIDSAPPASEPAEARLAAAARESVAGAPLASDVVASTSLETTSADGNWHEILTALKLGGMARELGQHCELRRINGVQIVLCLSPIHRHLQMKPAQDKLQQALSAHFARPLQLLIELEEVAGDTPAAVAQRQRNERQDRAVAAVEQDDFVREVIDIFDATLIESSIKPV
jgi:DNA polymerase-3 subunit gamma/tau